jgi:beta-glucosidase-like glycosyl hydrolase
MEWQDGQEIYHTPMMALYATECTAVSFRMNPAPAFNIHAAPNNAIIMDYVSL